LWGLKRYAESAAAFEKAYKKYSSSDDKAQALLKAGTQPSRTSNSNWPRSGTRKSLTNFTRAPLVPQAQLQLAECFAKLNDPDAAEEKLKKAGSRPARRARWLMLAFNPDRPAQGTAGAVGAGDGDLRPDHFFVFQQGGLCSGVAGRGLIR